MIAHTFVEQVRSIELVRRAGRVRKILPTFIEADGPDAPLGALCDIEAKGKAGSVLAQIVRVGRDGVVLAPFVAGEAIVSGARVTARSSDDLVPVGDAYLGRAIDGLGRPIDGGLAIRALTRAPIAGTPTAPLNRVTPTEVLETGLRAVDGLLTLGKGQRVGVFAPAGVGKTSLMNRLVRDVSADRCVICLVGERGREVEALWSKGLPDDVKRRSVLVAATSDQTASMRVRASDQALALAEHWRSQGLHVLLVLDSVTRLAMALRETGLAAGEPPTVRAYTPGVFAAIPRLVERCGAVASGGAISAVITVLSESVEMDDPISEMMKSLLDGHLLLSRELAEQGHFPAIDVSRSISRLALELGTPEHRALASRIVALLGAYEASRTLIEAGVYQRGASPETDRAIERRPAMTAFLRQAPAERSSLAQTLERLREAAGAAA